jgi:hypothetical protein
MACIDVGCTATCATNRPNPSGPEPEPTEMVEITETESRA